MTTLDPHSIKGARKVYNREGSMPSKQYKGLRMKIFWPPWCGYLRAALVNDAPFELDNSGVWRGTDGVWRQTIPSATAGTRKYRVLFETRSLRVMLAHLRMTQS